MSIGELPKPWVRAPLVESATLSKAAGCRVFLKLENMQPSGSFKSRGLGYMIRQKVLEAGGRPLHFYTSSGGNAGLGAIGAARTLGQQCTVVVPVTTKAFMVAKLHAAGATKVIQTGAAWKEADTYLREELLPNDPAGVYVPPFNNPLIFEGNSTLVDEVVDDMAPRGANEPDAFVCSVGGGGLFSGIMQGVQEHYGGRPTVVAVETAGCASLDAALKADELVTLPAITSLAVSLGASRVAERTFELARRRNAVNTVITDAEAAMGCWRFADDHRLLVELACGAALCLIYNGRLPSLIPNFSPKSKVVIVVCGGSAVSLEVLDEYKQSFAADVKQYAPAETTNPFVASTHTA